MIDAFKRRARAASGRHPFYSYGRSDKKTSPASHHARLVADMITVAAQTGSSRWISTRADPGFFNIPVDELTAVHLLSNYFRQKKIEDLVVVTDLGTPSGRTFAELLDAPRHHREAARRQPGPRGGHERHREVRDRGRSSSTTDRHRRHALRGGPRAPGRGVEEIYACATHGVLSDPRSTGLPRPPPGVS